MILTSTLNPLRMVCSECGQSARARPFGAFDSLSSRRLVRDAHSRSVLAREMCSSPIAVNDTTIRREVLADARAHSLLNTGQAGLQPDCKLQLQSVLVRVTRQATIASKRGSGTLPTQKCPNERWLRRWRPEWRTTSLNDDSGPIDARRISSDEHCSPSRQTSVEAIRRYCRICPGIPSSKGCSKCRVSG